LDSSPFSRLVRIVLTVFLLTFLAVRCLVLAIMTRRAPDLYVHVGGTHVHHLNFGIFLLSGVGAWLLFARPTGRWQSAAAGAYGLGLALTFDEFGMWVHLGGSYWQRASFDAVVIIAVLLGLLAVAPALKRFAPRHFVITAVLIAALAGFGWLLRDGLRYAGTRIAPRLQRIELSEPG
jgi:hypothetical protein